MGNFAATSRRGRSARSAFTLLELVVALVMVAILAESLYVTLHIAFQASASAETALAPARAANMVMEFIRQDLQNAMQPAIPSNPNALVGSPRFLVQGVSLNSGVDAAFEGTNGGNSASDDLVFFTTADSPDHLAANGEVKRVELTMDTDAAGAGHVLLRRSWRNLLALSEVQPKCDEEVLCRHVTAFHLRYFNGTNWLDTWDSTQVDNTVPAAVEVTLEFRMPGDSSVTKPTRIVRVLGVSCSTAATDPAANDGGIALP